MSLPFFDRGAPRLDEIVKPGMLCVFDFDDTLAPIAEDPDMAYIPAAILRRLIVLSEHARVAIITGRSVDDVSTRLDFMPDFVIGNHGLEGVPGWNQRAEACRRLCLEWERRLAAAVSDCALFDQKIRIENKTCSLSVHYLGKSASRNVETRLAELFARLIPEARVIAGEDVFHLMASDAPGKLAVLGQLRRAINASGAIYVGGDTADDDMFSDRGENVLTVRIKAVGNSASEFHLSHRQDVLRLLDELIGRLGAPVADPLIASCG